MRREICPVCEEEGGGKYGLCGRCEKEIRREIFPSLCPKCGYPLTDSTAPCPKCPTRAEGSPRIFRATFYSGLMREVLGLYKFGLDRRFIPLFADLAVETLKRIPDIDLDKVVLVPVPASRSGMRKRGFDQSMAICMATGLRWEPILRLSADGGRGEQKKKNRRERLSGTKKSKYRVDEELLELVKKDFPEGLKLIALDDICTTGATIRACSALLKGDGLVISSKPN